MKKEKRNLTFTSDPGHGWLSVTLKDLKELDIVDKISQYSYMTTTRAYLEEDCDAGVFLKAAKEKDWEISQKDTYAEKTPIRNYPSYDSKKVDLAISLSVDSDVMLYNSSSKSFSTKAKVVKIEDNKIFLKCEFNNSYRVSKTKFLSSVAAPPKEDLNKSVKLSM